LYILFSLQCFYFFLYVSILFVFCNLHVSAPSPSPPIVLVFCTSEHGGHCAYQTPAVFSMMDLLSSIWTLFPKRTGKHKQETRIKQKEVFWKYGHDCKEWGYNWNVQGLVLWSTYFMKRFNRLRIFILISFIPKIFLWVAGFSLLCDMPSICWVLLEAKPVVVQYLVVDTLSSLLNTAKKQKWRIPKRLNVFPGILKLTYPSFESIGFTGYVIFIG
jgi:hypothetical protein